jgi:CRISPR-associated protein Csd2
MSNTVEKRYEFVLLFDVKDGNPNGDPDAGNLPRLDAETGHGLVTDVCLKRKIRNYVGIKKGDQAPHEIYVKEKAVLNNQNKKAYEALTLDPKAEKKNKQDNIEKTRPWMCQNFYDVRTFGAVMSTEINCGQVRGAVQLTFSRSEDQIISSEHSITRMAVTTENEALAQGGDNRTMGRKHTVPYGLYSCKGFISAHFAKNTGFSKDDLKLLFEALENMFESDRSASRGEMATQKLIIFEHNSALGEAPAHKLFDKIKINKKSQDSPPRKFADYELGFEAPQPPEGGVDEEINKITNALQSDQTVITIAVNEGGKLELNPHPEWKK